MIRHAKRMIAMLLAGIMLMQISPITQMKVFAADESMGEAVEAEQLAEILYEDVTQREENSKRYRLGDGKWVAAVYEDAVHYEVDGQWEDIDNTLKSSTESYRIPVEPGKVTGEYTVNGFVEIGDTEVMSEITEIPEPSEAPELAPEVTEEPEEVTESEVTETPEEVTEPEVTGTPEDVTEPEVTEAPEEATETEATETIEEITELETTETPEDVTEPEVTGTPEDVTEPEATETPEEVIEPEAIETPETETDEAQSGQTTIGENAAVEILPITPPVVTLEPITPNPNFKDVSEQVWVNTANDIGISLPATLTGDSRVRISSKGYALYFAPVLESGKSDGNVSLMALREQGIAAQQIAIDNSSDDVRLKGIENKARSGLTYADVLPGVDMEYHLQSRTLKETIVVDSAENMPATIGYTISAEGLTPVVNEDNSIYFVADGEIIFCLPAPYMFDSANAVSFDVAVSLQALDNGEYLLTYTPDAEWISAEERVWPVCIDPVVDITPSTSTVEDTFVCENAATTNYEGLNYVYVGKQDTEGKTRAYVKYKTLPELTSSDVVLNAYMYMQGISMSGSQMTVSAYRVANSWNKSTLTWNTKPGTDYAALDYQIVAYANRTKQFCWDITQAAKQWYSDGTNYGIELRSDAESNSTGVVIKFGSAERAAGLRPNLMIYYTSNTGLESFWDYTSQDVGRAGTAHVNNFTGNLVVSRTDMSYGGNKMPAAITFNYNYTDRDTNLGYGNGWRMNYNHKITIENGTTGTSSYTYYRWVDGDGTRRNFNFASSHWYDETGQGYILTENTGSTTARFVITDKSGSRLEFDGYGRLKKVVDPNVSSNCVTIEYVAASSTNLRIKKITDGAGRVYQFEYYNDTNLLKEVSYYGTGTGKLNTVTYEYGSTTLTKVKYNDNDENNNGTAGYEYSSTALTKLINKANSESIAVTYEGGRVKQLAYEDIIAGETKPVSSATFEYGGDNTKVTDMQGCWVTYQFNDFGNTTGVFNDRGQAVFGSYAQDKDSSARANQLVDSSRLQDTVVNLIQDPSFEKATSMWSCSSNAEIVAEQVNNVYQSSTGQKMAKLSAKDAYVQYPFAFTAGETYTISVAVKTKDGGKVQIEAASTATGTVKSEPLSTNNWTRLELTFTATANTTVKFKSVQSGTGVVYLDDAQLELTDASSRYNLLTNGDFSDIADVSGWSLTGWSGNNTSGLDGSYVSTDTKAWTPEVTDENVLLLDKSYLVEKSAYQVVQVPGGQAGDKYTFGVWVKSPSVPLDNSRAPGDTSVRRCGIKVRAVGANGEVASEQILINDACNDWQYLCGSLECDENYTSVEVYLLFSYCQNTAMFDGAQLFRESYGYHYEYDDNGNVTSVTDLSGQKTTYNYNANQDVTSVVFTDGTNNYTYDYTYNNARQLTQTQNTMGTTAQYTYDSYGNVTQQKVGYSGASAYITSNSEYDSTGNMTTAVTTTDRQRIAYSNDLSRSLVNSVTDPLGRVTSYTYDTMDRPLTVTRNSSVLTYTYSADAVSAISHTGGNGSNGGPTTYTFNYGVADVLQSVGIKKDNLLITLVTNDYYDGAVESGVTEPKTWNLESQTYANGQIWSYQYYEDSEGHQTSELKSKILHNDDAAKSVKYKYMYYYSNDGAVARIEYYEGSTLQQVEKYYYDTSDRLCRVVGLNGSTTSPSVLYEYSWTYDHNNNVTNLVEIIDGVKTVYNYGYNTEQQASSTAYGNTHKTFAYDGYGRFSNSIVYAGSVTADNERVKEYVEYKIATDGNATNQVSRFISKWSRNTSDTSSEIYQYTYDANGNITEIKDGSGNYLVKYQYDANDQLQWEWNHQTNQAWYYGYDTGGNILYKHFYSNKEGTTKTDTIYYSYDGTWGDKLTKYDGVDTGADASGNIKNLNGWSYTYQGGRQLATASTTGKNLSFAYNDAGLRTSKTYNGTVHTYTYNGSLLASDVVKNANGVLQYAFYFRYDQNGAPIGFGYKSSSSAAIVEYYYLKNLQGDITGIVDTSGNRVATYVYDAWGNHLKVLARNSAGNLVDATEEDIAQRNPLRYRGYVYDTESSLYYLQSRYYSPAIGRFISADSYAVTYGSAVGANMFAYCGNNPTKNEDRNGDVWETAFDVISLGLSVADVVANPANPWAWAGLAGDVIDVAVPFVGGVGEAIKFCGTINRADGVIDAAKQSKKMVSKSVGAYEIKYASGKNYVGKGSFDRAIKSAERYANPHKLNDMKGDQVLSITWVATNDDKEAFMLEYMWQHKGNKALSKLKNAPTYNKIMSPGGKYLGWE